ncbi:hypothetical protein [Salinisphaera sp.]|uniref:hypothetical protein n=1 Tax=Salinisphaera sp. TaxID=1914330 RepID=UPI002D786D3A|nr:hypothetical protein [Salinisphaera sp.]HET7314619.1 hypothetical protein [Salinisphaera sp.]
MNSDNGWRYSVFALLANSRNRFLAKEHSLNIRWKADLKSIQSAQICVHLRINNFKKVEIALA